MTKRKRRLLKLENLIRDSTMKWMDLVYTLVDQGYTENEIINTAQKIGLSKIK